MGRKKRRQGDDVSLLFSLPLPLALPNRASHVRETIGDESVSSPHYTYLISVQCSNIVQSFDGVVDGFFRWWLQEFTKNVL